tara:strand:+ start:2537 stop:4096 length:1560 start_codon:yes stop_codon:yes gene_type:complete
MASIFELAQKINRNKQQSGGNQYFDNSMQVMKYLDERSKEGTSRTKTSMATTLGGFDKIYDNNVLQKRLDTFEKKFGGNKLNKMNVDERESYDNAKIMLGQHMEKNASFSNYTNQAYDLKNKMNSWMENAPADGYVDEKSSKTFKDMMEEYVNLRRDFSVNHMDRLSKKGSVIASDMDAMHNIGSFVLNSFKDDNVMSTNEHGIFSNAMATLDTQGIKDYYTELSTRGGIERNEQVKSMNVLLKEYNNKSNAVQSGVIFDSDGIPTQLSLEEKEAYEGEVINIKKKLENLDKRYQDSGEGDSYLESQGFGKKEPLPSGDEKVISKVTPKVTPKVDPGILNPDEESAKVKSHYVKSAKRITENVNKAKEAIDTLKDKGVIPAWETSRKGVSTPTAIGKHLNLKEGESVSIRQLRGIKAEYDKEQAESDSIKKEIKENLKLWNELPREEKKEARGDIKAANDKLRERSQAIYDKWNKKEKGWGGTFIESVQSQIGVYESAEAKYQSELKRLREFQERTKKD